MGTCPDYTVPEIRWFINSSFPELKITDLEVLDEGWDNIVALVNGGMVFRFPRDESDSARLKREIALLSRIRDFPVRLPEYSHIARGTPFFAGYPYISGNRLDSARELVPRLLKDMVGVITRLRSIDWKEIAGLGIPYYTPSTWHERQSDFLMHFENHLSRFTGKAIFSKLERFLEEAIACIPENSMSLVHADMFKGNVITTPASDRIVGIIDWEDSIFADVAIDIAALGLDFGKRGTAKILNAMDMFGEDPDIGERVAFYQSIEVMYMAEHLLKTNEEKKARELLREAGKT